MELNVKLWCRWTLTLAVVLFGVFLIEKAETRLEEVKCVCDGGCEHLRAEDCLYGLTFDMCRCCLVCARGEGEPCGGALGTCAFSLHCQVDHNETNEGRCSRDGICEKPEEQFGCVVGAGGNCICSSRTGCPDEEMFLFETEDSCKSRVAFLIARKDLEPATSFSPATDDCSKVHCSPAAECPADSYRLPTIVDTSHPDCCPTVEKCQCIPDLLCPPKECHHGWSEHMVLNATGQPGRCCPLHKCVKDDSTTNSQGEHEAVEHEHDDYGEDYGSRESSQSCHYEGKVFHSGETWSHHQDCTQCFCHHGVVSCKPLKCDLPAECRLARAEPESCCPVCVGCVTESGKVYNNSDAWEEDPCTTCHCREGRIQCQAAMCQTTCLNPRHVPGECCPRCDNGPSDKEDCPFFDCRRECPNGFRLDRNGCPTCKCNKCRGLADCTKECSLGYESNEKGCAICQCRTSSSAAAASLQQLKPDNLLLQTDNTKNTNQISAAQCVTTTDGISRTDGEEWSDHCRRCICKDHSEMCSLITCSPPTCEHPIFYPGDCCPRCPDEEVGESRHPNVSICQSSDGTQRLEKEIWNLGPCLTCTCHNGQVLCSAPECPPAPCSDSLIQNPGDCCLTCPHLTTTELDPNSITSNSSHSKPICFSDDSAKQYADGETWKVGACQSCVCRNGQIRCFSAGKCPPLDCERPVLAKNQCCPICLEQEKVKTKNNDVGIGSSRIHSSSSSSSCYQNNRAYESGQSWKTDECIQCFCYDGQIKCTQRVCSVGCSNPVTVPGECCPICPETKSRKRPIIEDGHSKSSARTKSGSTPNSLVLDDQEDGIEEVEGSRTHVSPSGSVNGRGELEESSGLEPHCAIIIASLLCVSLLLALYVLRQCFFRRPARLIKKAPFHSSNSSTSPPVTPDCCYKCDYNYSSSCAQLSEQKPLFKPVNVLSSSDKV